MLQPQFFAKINSNFVICSIRKQPFFHKNKIFDFSVFYRNFEIFRSSGTRLNGIQKIWKNSGNLLSVTIKELGGAFTEI